MRCDLAAALLHAPAILFLDEPTIGLDAVAKLAFRDFIRRFNRERGVTVILTTHDMDDIEALCTRVMVIGNGRILSDGTLQELRNRITRERRLVVDLVEEDAQVSDPHAVVTQRDGHRVHLSFDPDEVSAAELIARITSAHPISDLFVENPPIEEIVARMYDENRL
jgi:ABC-2 type transport system ATP-binding protein